MNHPDSPRGPKKARIEIIPLIDVVFFLLATFVLFTLSLQSNRVLDLPLPSAGTPGRDDRTAYIQASQSGTYYWKIGAEAPAELISSAEIQPRLVMYRRDTDAPRVFIRSDNQAKLGDAVRVLDEVRRAGITQVSVETVPSRTAN
jgi:biopolymer transport protein ExbD